MSDTPRGSERRQLNLLTRGFLARFGENDVMAEGTDFRRSLIWLLAFFVTPGVLVSASSVDNQFWIVLLARRFPDILETTSWRMMSIFIGLTMSASGMVAAAAWDSLTLQRRDCLILMSLPVRARTIVAAKLIALIVFSFGLAIGMNAPTALHYGVMSPTPSMSALDVGRRILAVIVATAGASLFVFWSAVALQGVVHTLFRPRLAARVSEAAQWLIAFGSLLLFLVLLLLAARIRVPLLHYDGVHWPRMFWLPLFWFLGLYELLIGSSRAAMPMLARLAAIGFAGSIVVSLVTYLAAFDRRVRAMIEQPGFAGGRARPLAARVVDFVGWRVSRTAAEAAMHLFIVRSFMRSRVHRLGLSAALGLGFALVTYGMLGRRGQILASTAEITPALLSIPLVLLFCGVCGMRVLFALPTEPMARWCFELWGDRDPYAHVRAARAVVLVWLVFPICLATFAVSWPVWGAPAAAYHALYCAVLGAALTEVAVARLRRIPFTCRWIPGAANLKLTWPVFTYAFAFFAYRMARFEASLLQSPARWAAFCAGAAVVTVGCARLYARRRRDREPNFDESLEPAIQTLDLQTP